MWTLKYFGSVLVVAAIYAQTSDASTKCAFDREGRMKENSINVQVTILPSGIDPTLAWNFQQFMVLQTVLDTLVRVNDSEEIVAGLAKKWKISNDGKAYEFELDEHATFQDGSPILAKDVAFSLARHFWPSSKSIVASYLRPIIFNADNTAEGKLPQGIEILGEHSFRLITNGYYPPLLKVLAMPGFSIVPHDRDLHSKTPAGSGVMKASISGDGKQWFLERRTDTSMLGPKTSKFCFVENKDFHDPLAGLRNGTIDLAISVPFSQVSDGQLPKGVRVFRTESLGIYHLFLNPKKAVFKSIEQRRAFANLVQGVARDSKNHSHFEEPLETFFPPGIMPRQYYVRKHSQQYNTTKLSGEVRILLVEGLTSIEFSNALKSALKAAGIKAHIEMLRVAKILEEVHAGHYDVAAVPYVGSFPDPDGFLDLLRPGLVFPKGFVPALELDAEIGKHRFLKEPAERFQSYEKAMEHFESKFYVVPVFRNYFPLVGIDTIRIPDSTYRFEFDFRNIFLNLTKNN